MNSNLASTSYSQPELPRFITNPHNNDTQSVDELARDKAGSRNANVRGQDNIDEKCKLLIKVSDRKNIRCREFLKRERSQMFMIHDLKAIVASYEADKKSQQDDIVFVLLRAHPSVRKGGCYQVHDIEDLFKVGEMVKGYVEVRATLPASCNHQHQDIEDEKVLEYRDHTFDPSGFTWSYTYVCIQGGVGLLLKGIAPVAIIDRQLPFEYTITSRSTDVVVMTTPILNINHRLSEEGKPVAAYVIQMKWKCRFIETNYNIAITWGRHVGGGLLEEDCPVYLTELLKKKKHVGFCQFLEKQEAETRSSLFVRGNGVRAQVEAIGSFDLVLPNGLVICIDNYHYAPSILRGVVLVHRLVENGFV
ncbi:hypothetical protein Tco_0051113 [Tanacetum coccineum]